MRCVQMELAWRFALYKMPAKPDTAYPARPWITPLDRNGPHMPDPSAAASGQFEIGGDITINRLGFGAMRITGKSIWGDPADPQGARETLKRVPGLGINFI